MNIGILFLVLPIVILLLIAAYAINGAQKSEKGVYGWLFVLWPALFFHFYLVWVN